MTCHMKDTPLVLSRSSLCDLTLFAHVHRYFYSIVLLKSVVDADQRQTGSGFKVLILSDSWFHHINKTYKSSYYHQDSEAMATQKIKANNALT